MPVSDVVDASRVSCGGPGLTPGHVRANVPQTFTVDTSKAGVAPLDVKVQGPKGQQGGIWGVLEGDLWDLWGFVAALRDFRAALWAFGAPSGIFLDTMWAFGVALWRFWGFPVGFRGCPVGF